MTDIQDAKRHRYARATTAAIRDPETGERIEVTPELYDAAIDSAMANDPNWERGVKARDLKAAQHEGAKALLDGMTDAQRAELFGHYCQSCGSKDATCQCWNDE